MVLDIEHFLRLKEQIYSIFRWACPTSIYGFSWCACVRASVRASVRVRKLVEAEMTMTVNIKVVRLHE